MFKVKFINVSGIEVVENVNDQYELEKFLSTLDNLDCEIISVTTIKSIPIQVLRGISS